MMQIQKHLPNKLTQLLHKDGKCKLEWFYTHSSTKDRTISLFNYSFQSSWSMLSYWLFPLHPWPSSGFARLYQQMSVQMICHWSTRSTRSTHSWSLLLLRNPRRFGCGSDRGFRRNTLPQNNDIIIDQCILHRVD